MSRADKIRFDRMVDHLRAIGASAEKMFDSRTYKKIVTKADKLLTELRNARKRQLQADDEA